MASHAERSDRHHTSVDDGDAPGHRFRAAELTAPVTLLDISGVAVELELSELGGVACVDRRARCRAASPPARRPSPGPGYPVLSAAGVSSGFYGWNCPPVFDDHRTVPLGRSRSGGDGSL